MPPLRDTLSRRSKTSCNRSYSPLLCRSRKSVSLSWRDGPLSANSIFTPTPPMQKQYGFLTVCKNREMRSFRESALSKVIPLTSGRDSAATAPMSTLFICSSSCVVNFTVNLLRRYRTSPAVWWENATGQHHRDAGLLPYSTLGHFVSRLIIAFEY